MSNDYPCPSWCHEGKTRPVEHGENDWSDSERESSRPHATAVIQRTDGGCPGTPGSTQHLRLDIGADEVAPRMVDGTWGPSVLEEPLIRIAMWVAQGIGRQQIFLRQQSPNLVLMSNALRLIVWNGNTVRLN